MILFAFLPPLSDLQIKSVWRHIMFRSWTISFDFMALVTLFEFFRKRHDVRKDIFLIKCVILFPLYIFLKPFPGLENLSEVL
jgi:hypothetical protein